MNKLILDACCGPRFMWLRKNHPNAIYIDIRKEHIKSLRGEIIKVDPDIIMDFRKLDFPDNTFYLVVMDPPHIISLKPRINIMQKYGILNPETWKDDLKKGIKECMRVLKPNGVFILKLNDSNLKKKDMFKLFPEQPLFINEIQKKGGHYTYWFCFMKIEKVENDK